MGNKTVAHAASNQRSGHFVYMHHVPWSRPSHLCGTRHRRSHFPCYAQDDNHCGPKQDRQTEVRPRSSNVHTVGVLRTTRVISPSLLAVTSPGLRNQHALFDRYVLLKKATSLRPNADSKKTSEHSRYMEDNCAREARSFHRRLSYSFVRQQAHTQKASIQPRPNRPKASQHFPTWSNRVSVFKETSPMMA